MIDRNDFFSFVFIPQIFQNRKRQNQKSRHIQHFKSQTRDSQFEMSYFHFIIGHFISKTVILISKLVISFQNWSIYFKIDFFHFKNGHFYLTICQFYSKNELIVSWWDCECKMKDLVENTSSILQKNENFETGFLKFHLKVTVYNNLSIKVWISQTVDSL